MRNEFVLRAIASEVWALLPEKFYEICAFLQARALHDVAALTELKARVVGPNDVPRAQQIGGVAVVPVFGTIANRMSLMSEISGGASAEAIKAQVLKAVQDDAVSAIVLDVNSPGGTVDGLTELHSAIMAARGVKPIIAISNTMAASAAYWIATAADSISITPSGKAGSIGVFMAHEDISKMADTEGVKVTLISAGKYKTEGNQFEPLNEDARASLQQRVDEAYSMFVADVAAGRNVTAKDVRSGYGEGRVLGAKASVDVGLTDRVETLDQLVSRLNKSKVSAVAGRSRAMANDVNLTRIKNF